MPQRLKKEGERKKERGKVRRKKRIKDFLILSSI